MNTIRATFASWHDRVIAALMLIAALAVVRAQLTYHPWTIAAWAALVAGTMIGIGAGRLIVTRLAFHASDGLLADNALHRQTRWRDMTPWPRPTLLVALTSIARSPLLSAFLPVSSERCLLN